MNTSNTYNTRQPPGPECARYTEMLPQLRQGTLSAADEQSLRAHLATCAFCQARLGAYDRLDAALRSHLNHFAATAPSADDLVAVAVERDASLSPAARQRETPREFMIDGGDTRDTTYSAGHPMPVGAGRTQRRSRPHPALAVIAALLLVGLAAALFATISRTNNVPAHNGAATATTAPTATTATRLPPTPLHLPAGATLVGLSMASPTDGWAVGFTADTNHLILLRFHDGQWTIWQGSQSVGPSSGGIAMTSATDGWLTSLGGFLHYTNNRWVAVPVPAISAVESVEMISPTDGWARANLLVANQNGFEGLLHFSDGVWSLVTLPAGLNTSRASMSFTFSVTPTGECWLMYSDANTSITKILRYIGGAFQQVSTLSHVRGETITMRSSHDGWLTATDAGGNAVYHFDGSAWTKVAIPASSQQQRYLYGIVTSPSGAAWLFGGSGSDTGSAARYSNGAWELVKTPSNITPSTFNLVTDDEGWALDTYPHRAAIYHYQHGAWTPYPN